MSKKAKELERKERKKERKKDIRGEIKATKIRKRRTEKRKCRIKKE